MIDFNQCLQALGDNITIAQKLNKQFVSTQSNQLIKFISTLDPHSKGYLTHGELVKSNSSNLLNFINKQFQERVTYTTLASYLQKFENNSSANIQLNQINIQPENIIELLETQCSMQGHINFILNNIHKYLMPVYGKINNMIFENYCHSQKLRINPTVLFNYLSRNHEFILVPSQFQFLQSTKEEEEKLRKTQRKINKLNDCLQKLDKRVNQFGVQWL